MFRCLPFLFYASDRGTFICSLNNSGNGYLVEVSISVLLENRTRVTWFRNNGLLVYLRTKNYIHECIRINNHFIFTYNIISQIFLLNNISKPLHFVLL